MQVQLGDKLVLVREGKVVHVLATAHSSLFPRVAAVRPLVAEPDTEGAVAVSQRGSRGFRLMPRAGCRAVWPAWLTIDGSMCRWEYLHL